MFDRRTILIPLLALTLSFAWAPGAGAAFYLGGGHGIRVAFRVKGHRLIWANVHARLYCIGPDGERHLNRVKKIYATPDAPLQIDRRGRFLWDTRGAPAGRRLSARRTPRRHRRFPRCRGAVRIPP